MIERNHVVDRRVILEAQEVAALGAEVEILCLPGAAASAESTTNNPAITFREVSLLPIWEVQPTHDIKAQRSSPAQFRLSSRFQRIIDLFVRPNESKLRVIQAESLSRAQSFIVLLALTLITPLGLGFKNWMRRIRFYGRALINALRSKDPASEPGVWELQVLRALKGQRYDVVHVHDLPCLALGVALKNQMGSKLVYDSHEFYPHQHHFSLKARLRFKWLEESLLRNCDAIVLVNEKQKEFLTSKRDDSRFVVLPNATVNSKKAQDPKKTDLRMLLKIPEGERILVFQGALTKNRSIDLLIQGLALTRTKVHLVLISWPNQDAWLRPIAASAGVTNRVHFIGPFPWNEIEDWIASADGGVIPYQPVDLNARYSLPNKLYEFISAGIPILGNSNLFYVNEIVGGERFGVCIPLESALDYGRGIDRLFESSVAYDSFKQRLLEKRLNYTWEYCAISFRNYYSDLFGNLLETNQSAVLR